MTREAPEIRLIRETLEGVLHPSTASTVFFEALQASGGALPTTPEQLATLVRGPLRRGLAERVGEDRGAEILDQLELMLAALGSKGRARRRPSRHDQPTAAVTLSDVSLRVFVLSGGAAFGEQLKASLGPQVMSLVPVVDADTLRIRLDQVPPSMVLLDGGDFPAIEPEDLVTQLSPLPAEVVKAVWGADLPYGQRVLDAAQRRGLGLTPFDRSEGVAPLLDLIRSRRASG
jgi:hypothetical protein